MAKIVRTLCGATRSAPQARSGGKSPTRGDALDYLALRRRGSGMRSTTDVALFLLAFFNEMNRPVLAERPRSENRGFLVAMKIVFPAGAPAERDSTGQSADATGPIPAEISA